MLLPSKVSVTLQFHGSQLQMFMGSPLGSFPFVLGNCPRNTLELLRQGPAMLLMRWPRHPPQSLHAAACPVRPAPGNRFASTWKRSALAALRTEDLIITIVIPAGSARHSTSRVGYRYQLPFISHQRTGWEQRWLTGRPGNIVSEETQRAAPCAAFSVGKRFELTPFCSSVIFQQSSVFILTVK